MQPKTLFNVSNINKQEKQPMSIYLHIDGVQGNVTTQDYNDWIECMDCCFDGITNTVSQHIGSDMDRVIHYPKFGEISIHKALDKSSIALFEYAHNRHTIPTVDIHYTTSGNPIFTFSKMSLKNVIISHYSELNSDALYNKPQEHIVLSYTAIEKTYIPRNSDNIAESPIVSGYDLSQGQAM